MHLDIVLSKLWSKYGCTRLVVYGYGIVQIWYGMVWLMLVVWVWYGMVWWSQVWVAEAGPSFLQVVYPPSTPHCLHCRLPRDT